jgi:hypothetical protein
MASLENNFISEPLPYCDQTPFWHYSNGTDVVDFINNRGRISHALADRRNWER